MESDIVYREIFDKISELSGIKFKFSKTECKDSEKHDSFLLKIKKSGYSDLLLSKTDDRFYRPSELCIVRPKGSKIPLEKYAIAAIKENKLHSITGRSKKNGKRETIFTIPDFESSIELKMKLDLF